VSTYVYVDGLNFYYGAVKGTPYKWVDLEAVVKSLVPKDQLGLIRYFTAIVKPQSRDDRVHERQQSLIRAMEANPLIRVKLGHFRKDVRWRAIAEDKHGVEDLFRPQLRPSFLIKVLLARAQHRRTESATCARVWVPEEKGSDVNLATYLVYDALTNPHITKFLVISNDSDLEEAVRIANTRAQVGIVNPHRGPTSGQLSRVSSFQIPFRREILKNCQMPKTVTTSGGRQVHRPKEW